MPSFPIHDTHSAPEGARATLATVEKQFGFLPNLFAGLAESPAALHGYLALSEQFGKSGLSPVEQQVLAISVSVDNGCEFCVGAHSFIARNVTKVDGPIVDALRAGTTLPDARLDALAVFARTVVRERGWVPEAALERFLAAGYSRANVLDVILGVAMKTLSNYANHVIGTPLNTQFAAERWTAQRRAA
jgi:uncharacterized peroxidase-related enzyme